jgi:hypothetical protein
MSDDSIRAALEWCACEDIWLPDRHWGELEFEMLEQGSKAMAAALRAVLDLCEPGLPFEDPATLKWYIRRAIAEKLGDE